jgi:hypothetical protein
MSYSRLLTRGLLLLLLLVPLGCSHGSAHSGSSAPSNTQPDTKQSKHEHQPG